MRFEWDEEKNRQNFAKHGIWFEDAKRIFSGTTVTYVDDRFDYDELREITIGLLNGVKVLSVTHTDRSGTVRLISARKASAKEVRLYGSEV